MGLIAWYTQVDAVQSESGHQARVGRSIRRSPLNRPDAALAVGGCRPWPAAAICRAGTLQRRMAAIRARTTRVE